MSQDVCTICKIRCGESGSAMVMVPRNENTRQLWSEVCGINLQRSALICGRHFTEKDFIVSGEGSAKRRRLKADAIPSMILPQIEIKSDLDEFIVEETGKDANNEGDMYTLEVEKTGGKEEIIEEYIHEEIFNDKVIPEVDTLKQYTTLGVQTGSSRTRTCGWVQVTADNQMYSLNCFHCDEVFALWDWIIFIKHLKEQHNANLSDTGQGSDATDHEDETTQSDNGTDVEEEVGSTNIDDESNASNMQDTEEEDAEDGEEEGEDEEFMTLTSNDHDVTENATSPSPKRPDSENEDGEKNINCDLCSSSFYDEAHLQIHQILRHQPQELPYQCKHCDQRFASLNKYEKHVREHSALENYFCPRCNKGFPDEATLSEHKAVHKVCDICDKKLPTPSKYRLHMLLHEPPKYKCSICSKLYHKPRMLLEHLKAHRGQRDYVCEECGKAFVRQTNLVQHRLAVHSNEKFCECKICGFTFKSFGNLHHHRRRAHLVLEGTVEELANPAIRYRKHLTVFDATTNQRRVVCNVCGNTYRYHGGLRVHMIRAHGEEPAAKRRKIRAKPIVSKTEIDLPAAEENGMDDLYSEVDVDVEVDEVDDLIEQLDEEEDLEVTEVEMLDEEMQLNSGQAEIEIIEYDHDS